MSLTRYAPQLAQAFRLPLDRPAMLARCAAAWLVLALAAHYARGLGLPGGAAIPFALNALAFGAFAVAWQRFAARGEEPSTVVAVRLSWREPAWALSWQVFLGFEAVLSQMLAMVFANTQEGPVLAIAGVQAFQLLIGAMLLLLPHIALWQRGQPGPKLAEMITAGGLAVGLGYVLAMLPFTLLGLALPQLFGVLPPGPAADMALSAVQIVLSFLAVTVASGYFALVWVELRKSVAPAEPAAPPAEEPVKPRRTHRLNRNKR